MNTGKHPNSAVLPDAAQARFIECFSYAANTLPKLRDTAPKCGI